MKYHHWGKSWFDYYLSTDEAVFEKHARMLADMGVDVIIFDTSNQVTYPEQYLALCRAFTRVRKTGGRTPQIAFLFFGIHPALFKSCGMNFTAKPIFEFVVPLGR